MMILSASLSRDSLGTGLSLVVVMGLGIMVTIALVGTSGIAFRRGIDATLADPLARHRAVLLFLEISSAVVILAIGLYSFVAWLVA